MDNAQKLVKYNSYCEDCHFSKVKVNSICQDNSCLTCMYIGGNAGDLDEDGELNEPIDKCWIRADKPFYDTNGEDYIYYSEFSRDEADPDLWR